MLLAIALSADCHGQDDASVFPVEDWVRFEKMHYAGGPLEVHLRTGYQRPLIMPEPVRLTSAAEAPQALTVDIDIDIVILSPSRHFSNARLTLVGLHTGHRYLVNLRSSATGDRIPLRLEP